MDARTLRALCALVAAALSLGAGYRTQNFIVEAPTPRLAEEIGETAERLRAELAEEWLGHQLPPWSQPCPIRAQVAGHLGAGGATSFMFRGRQPSAWRMTVQGSRERVLDSVLPHEITHTVFATHFGQPLPRWADEGACTTVEHHSEKQRQEEFLREFLTTGRGIAFNRMFAMTEYPADIMPLYSQGFALAEFLIHQGGKRKFVKYIGDGLRARDWTSATRAHYGFQNLSELQLAWVDWVKAGRPSETDMILAIRGQHASGGAAVRLASATSADTTTTPDSATPVAPAAPPTTSLASADSGGWYARQRGRDEATAATPVEPAARIAPPRAEFASSPVAYTPGSTASVEPITVAATRPPAAETPGQTVLEETIVAGGAASGGPRTRLAPVPRY